MNLERQRSEGSQSNRDKLYKRFKKLNGTGATNILQNRSQPKLIPDNVSTTATRHNNGSIKIRQSATKSSKQNQSIQKTMTPENLNEHPSKVSSMPKQIKPERPRKAGNFPYHSPTSASNLRNTSNGAGSA